MVRRALVAGMFYHHDPKGLQRQLEGCFRHRFGPGELPTLKENGARQIIGLVCPHAGYMYSGPTAAKAYATLAKDGIPQVAVILAPAHYNPSSHLAVWTEGRWETPLGFVQVAEEVSKALIGDVFREDFEPHLGLPGRGEHSIEVQIPFLQFIYGEKVPAIVPITVSAHNLDILQQAGEVLGKVLDEQNRDAVIIASCDFTHYEPHSVAQRHDREALERLIALDAEGLFATIHRYPSQSDVLASIPMLKACQRLKATSGEIIGYTTSGDITGDITAVVGYGAAVLKRAV